jgi:hypothetical protein
VGLTTSRDRYSTPHSGFGENTKTMFLTNDGCTNIIALLTIRPTSRFLKVDSQEGFSSFKKGTCRTLVSCSNPLTTVRDLLIFRGERAVEANATAHGYITRLRLIPRLNNALLQEEEGPARFEPDLARGDSCHGRPRSITA